MKSFIIGMGEIGRGLYEATKDYHETKTFDSGEGKILIPPDETDILHICIPGALEDFVKQCVRYIDLLNPICTVIHSSCRIGDTRLIMAESGSSCVHSPVRGRHPNMKDGLETYCKYIGFNDATGKLTAESFFHATKISTKSIKNSDTTELAKLLSTTRYGLNLMFAELTRRLCDKLDLNSFDVYKEWEVTYNQGLVRSGLGRYQRPVLDFPGEKIGGHCVVENAHMLLNQLYPDYNDNTLFASLLSAIVQVGKGDRELGGF